MNIYTLLEVKHHNNNEDCWIVANNKVYDVTKYIKEHPGGKYSIVKNAGTDQTKSYNFHSKKGKDSWNQYHIGFINKSHNCCIIN